MVAVVSETPAWLIVLPVVGTLLGVFVGLVVPELLRRRAAAEARYDSAIAAVSKAYAARHGVGLEFPAEWVRSPDTATHAQVQHELSKAALVRFLDATAEARSALAALYPWSPDLRQYWDRAFLGDEEFDPLIAILTRRRKSPLTRHDASSVG